VFFLFVLVQSLYGGVGGWCGVGAGGGGGGPVCEVNAMKTYANVRHRVGVSVEASWGLSPGESAFGN
jgi:hypothetical protein